MFLRLKIQEIIFQDGSAMVGWRRFGVGTISTSGHYVVNLPMSTKKQQMIGKGTWLFLLKVML